MTYRYDREETSNKFRLNRRNSKISGVCAGLADYTDVNVGVIRIGTVVAAFFTGFVPMAIGYVVLACVLD